jgi:hypothetical protein
MTRQCKEKREVSCQKASLGEMRISKSEIADLDFKILKILTGWVAGGDGGQGCFSLFGSWLSMAQSTAA